MKAVEKIRSLRVTFGLIVVGGTHLSRKKRGGGGTGLVAGSEKQVLRCAQDDNVSIRMTTPAQDDTVSLRMTLSFGYEFNRGRRRLGR